MSDAISFYVKFDGPALSTSEMDVRSLAPALLAIADAIDEANRELNGDQAVAKVSVRGSFKSGSFGIDLALQVDWLRELLSALNSDAANAALNLLASLGFVGAGGKGLLWLIRKIRNRKVQKVLAPDGERVTFVLEDQEEIVTTGDVTRLYRNRKVRYSLEKAFFEPLDREGITSVTLSHDGYDVEILKEEAELFRAPVLDEQHLAEFLSEAHLQIVTLSFQEDNKWRFSRGTGDGPFYALIRDQEFLDRVNRNEVTFAKGDLLKVRLRTRETLSDKGVLKTEQEVDKVLQHISMARQLPLPIERPEVEFPPCPPDRPIKGNRGANGMVYHMPGTASYEATKAEECFGTEAEAEAAGYRKAQR